MGFFNRAIARLLGMHSGPTQTMRVIRRRSVTMHDHGATQGDRNPTGEQGSGRCCHGSSDTYSILLLQNKRRTAISGWPSENSAENMPLGGQVCQAKTHREL